MIYCKSSNRTLIPWKISSVNPPSLTFREFFLSASNFEEPRELVATFVGRSKEETDEVDCDLAISEVCTAFGHFAKFYTQQIVCSEEDGMEANLDESKSIAS